MTIASLDDLIGATKQQFTMYKNLARTTVAAQFFTTRDMPGQPGATVDTTLTTGNARTTGFVPDDTMSGFPEINAFGGGATGYLMNFSGWATLASRLFLADLLWQGGSYNYNDTSAVSITSPSWSGRVPGGTDYTNTELWLEVTTAFATGTNWNISISYTNEAGTSGRTATLPAALAAASLTKYKMMRVPLQAGDVGVQSIQSIITTNGATAMTAGVFNVLVLRRLANMRLGANFGITQGVNDLGMPQIFDTSALFVGVAADSTAMPTFEVFGTIANK